MPTTIALHTLDELAQGSEKNAILLQTNINTELHIIRKGDVTFIKFPFGNRFDIVDGMILIHE